MACRQASTAGTVSQLLRHQYQIIQGTLAKKPSKWQLANTKGVAGQMYTRINHQRAHQVRAGVLLSSGNRRLDRAQVYIVRKYMLRGFTCLSSYVRVFLLRTTVYSSHSLFSALDGSHTYVSIVAQIQCNIREIGVQQEVCHC